MIDYKTDRIGSCVIGENPTLLVKMKSGFAVIADNQFLPGYCILLGYPQADSLNALSLEERAQYLTDMTLIGDAIIKTCAPLRINYETLMNLDNYLHTHIQPRYEWESDEYKFGPPFSYPKEMRYTPEYEFSEEKYGELKCKLRDNLLDLMKQAGYDISDIK